MHDREKKKKAVNELQVYKWYLGVCLFPYIIVVVSAKRLENI